MLTKFISKYNNYFFMKLIIVVGPVLFLMLIIFLALNPQLTPTAEDIPLDNSSKLNSYEGEVCDNPFREAVCLEGYICTNIHIEPYNVSVCIYEEDLEDPNFDYYNYRIDKLLQNEGIKKYY